MTVAYPITAQLDYTELRYSLRSLEKFLTPPFEVVIIGNHMPDWITGVTQIELADVPNKKQLSIRRKIYAALEYAEEILFMNDDVYLLQPASEFPYYWHGMLKNYSEPGSKILLKSLEEMSMQTKHFDGHYPLIYSYDFKGALEHFTDDVIIKSAYCNFYDIEGQFAPDCKLLKETKLEIIRNFIKDKTCFSTGTQSLKSALPILQELYPNKSNFEI